MINEEKERFVYMKTLYLHIGTPKTGTTSIQEFMVCSREALQKHGICYPDIQKNLQIFPQTVMVISLCAVYGKVTRETRRKRCWKKVCRS